MLGGSDDRGGLCWALVDAILSLRRDSLRRVINWADYRAPRADKITHSKYLTL